MLLQYFMTRTATFPNEALDQRSEPSLRQAPRTNSNLRKTGIALMAEAPWGTHVCLFYETGQDLLDANVAYFKAGLESNEHCVWAVLDPLTEEMAWAELRRGIPDLDRHLAAGSIEIILSDDFHFCSDRFDVAKIIDIWRDKTRAAIRLGRTGLRISGNAVWQPTDHGKEFCEYELAFDETLADESMLVLCTYDIGRCNAQDVLNVGRAHQSTIALRNGRWDFLQAPVAGQERAETSPLPADPAAPVKQFAGIDRLTPRERVMLEQIVRGDSSKETARLLGISPRTVEFHRANVMKKMGAKNPADLVRMVLGNGSSSNRLAKLLGVVFQFAHLV